MNKTVKSLERIEVLVCPHCHGLISSSGMLPTEKQVTNKRETSTRITNASLPNKKGWRWTVTRKEIYQTIENSSKPMTELELMGSLLQQGNLRADRGTVSSELFMLFTAGFVERQHRTTAKWLPFEYSIKLPAQAKYHERKAVAGWNGE